MYSNWTPTDTEFPISFSHSTLVPTFRRNLLVLRSAAKIYVDSESYQTADITELASTTFQSKRDSLGGQAADIADLATSLCQRKQTSQKRGNYLTDQQPIEMMDIKNEKLHFD